MTITFEVAKKRSPTKSWFDGLGQSDWEMHLRYILGEEVAGFRVKTKKGWFGPEWPTVLKYELAFVRRR